MISESPGSASFFPFRQVAARSIVILAGRPCPTSFVRDHLQASSSFAAFHISARINPVISKTLSYLGYNQPIKASRDRLDCAFSSGFKLLLCG